MLVDGSSTPGSASPLLLDSPTLARVERARLRHEGGYTGNISPRPLASLGLCQNFLEPGREIHAIKKGLLWQQRDRLFSRWKERYFILTRDYLHCFKKSSGKISEMGQFIFKIKLVDVERVEWINKKTHSTVSLVLGRDGRVLLRARDALEDWFELLEECAMTSKERRRALRNSHDQWSRGDNSITSNLEEWLIARHKMGLQLHLSDSVPELPLLQDSGPPNWTRQVPTMCSRDTTDESWLLPQFIRHRHRLSLLTDIDVDSCDTTIDTPPPSVPATFRGRPKRFNNDIFFGSAASSDNSTHLRLPGATPSPSFCSSRSVLTPVGSFRSTHLFNPAKVAADRHYLLDNGPQLLRYRERSLSDAHSVERLSRKRGEVSRRASYLVHTTQV